MPTLAGAQSCGMPAYRMLLESHFPCGDDGRIPTGLVLGTCDDQITIDLTAAILMKCVSSVGIATRDRFEVSGRAIGSTLSDDAARADVILRNPQSTVALLQTTEDAVAERGMPIDKCDVGVILLPGEQAGAAKAIGTEAAKLLISISRKSVVLNSGDPRISALLASAGEKRLIWILDELDATDVNHRRHGDMVVMIMQSGGQHFISILDDQAIHKIAIAPAELVQLGSTATACRRAALVAIGIAYELSAPFCDLSEFVQTSQRVLASKQ
jgi:cyanophycin synthetase